MTSLAVLTLYQILFLSFSVACCMILAQPRRPTLEVPESCFAKLGRTPWPGQWGLHKAYSTTHTRTNMHAFSGIRTHDPSILDFKTEL